MTPEERIQWMAVWAAKNGLKLELCGEVGFGRDCVGVTAEDCYPDYEWYDEDFKRVDENGEVWKPDDAYHKHPCVAVLGHGQFAEKQLYEWLKWFDENGFKLETGNQPQPYGVVGLLMNKHRYVRMVRKGKEK